jgi:hypothetical protein
MWLKYSRMTTEPMQRRSFLARLAAGAAVATAVPSTSVSGASREPAGDSSGTGLAEPAFRPLPLGAIRCRGWLERQLRLQADGLTGHLDEFWPDVAESQWFGGQAEGWERAPYWLDGLIPLAWTLNDAALKEKARRRVAQIVDGQRGDGTYAPYPTDPAKTYDLWAVLLVNKALVQYHEATGDDAVLQAVLKSLKCTLAILSRRPLFDWGRYRWYEGLVSAYYAYEKTGEPWLLEFARTVRAQGTDFTAIFASDDIRLATPRRGLWTWDKHVVNTGMALKAYALAWRLSRDPRDLAFPQQMLAILDRYHGQVTGMFSGDECLAGRSPTQGTELCAVVEAVYSLAQLAAMTGATSWADRLERIAFNALPATFAPDMWSHQYVQQVNQVQSTINPEAMWSTNGPNSNIFGLEPNYGCCTANLHQGWPKFAAHLWMRAPQDGLAAIAYAPCQVSAEVAGLPVEVICATDYPFRDTIKLSVRAPQSVRFPLLLRVPAWARHPEIKVGSGPIRRMQPGRFHRVQREWRGATEIELRFPMEPVCTPRYHQAIALERGPLVYSLKLAEDRTRVNADQPHRELPHGDFEVRPASPWNYGLLIDEDKVNESVRFEERPVGAQPFSPEGAGMMARVRGRRLPNWKLRHGWAEEVVPGLHQSSEPLEDLTLIPYGCTNIRVTEFPRLRG